ncbi:hypothetical protein [Haemophilus influenzae]|nr:hypothetical protein [Haemophilus influenzae]
MAKVAILAVPVVAFGQNNTYFKIASSVALLFMAYFALLGGKLIRKHKLFLSSSKED